MAAGGSGGASRSGRDAGGDRGELAGASRGTRLGLD